MEIVAVRREQHPPPVKGQQVAHMGYGSVLLSQVGHHKRLHRNIRLDLYGGPVRIAAQGHTGDTLLPQPPAELLHRRGLVLGIKQALHPPALQKRPDHLRVKVVGMVVGEQQVVQPLKGRLGPKHGLPAAGGQEAEGIVLPAEQPVQEQSRVPVADQHAGVGQQGYADGIAVHRFIFLRPRSHPSCPRNT